MSNVYSNPMIIDTAMTASLKNYKGPAFVPNARFIVSKVVWVNPTTNADTFAITDGAGTGPVTIAAGTCVTGSIGLPQTQVLDIEVADLQVTQISSGKLYIYLKELD